VFGFSNFDSSKLNERQNEQTQYGVLALQRSVNGFDGQLSYFTPEAESAGKPENRLRQTENPITRDANGLATTGFSANC
jgi:hypothetical protein